MAGRTFTLRELKKSILAACGRKLTSAYLTIWELEVWEIVECIELLIELQPEDPNEVDLEDMVG